MDNTTITPETLQAKDVSTAASKLRSPLPALTAARFFAALLALMFHTRANVLLLKVPVLVPLGHLVAHGYLARIVLFPSVRVYFGLYL